MGRTVADPDHEHVRRVQQGHLQAFRVLVAQYKDRSMSLAASIVKDAHLAEDITQDAFIKAYSRIGSFQYRSKFSTWLYRIVVNTAYNALKKRKPTVPVATAEHMAAGRTAADGVSPLTEAEQKKYIRLAMAQLKADEALALRLFYLGEHSLKEIEEITGSSASKIRVDLHRGRKNLKEQLSLLLGEEMKHLL